jgi:protein-S-isoprenylcysteine O-methyltransferase Ste14
MMPHLLFLLPWLIFASWAIFIGYWLVNVRRVKSTAVHEPLKSTLLNRLPTVAGGLLLLFPQLIPTLSEIRTPHGPIAIVFAVALCYVGLGIAIWARRTLADNWSSVVMLKEGHELIESGPYRFVRHPIYTGILVMILGSTVTVATAQGWLALLLFFLGFVMRLRQEEALLMTHFGAEYPEYRKRVKALVPFVV